MMILYNEHDDDDADGYGDNGDNDDDYENDDITTRMMTMMIPQ